MSVLQNRRIVWAGAVAVLAFAAMLSLFLLRRSSSLTSGRWEASQSGFTYSLRFERDGTLLVHTPEGTRYIGTYAVPRPGVVDVHIPNVLPWGEVRILEFS